MKAVVYREYGSPDVLKYEDVEKPIPKANEVLVKVRAAGINAADRLTLSGKPFMVRLAAGGLFKPKNLILGFDIAGEIETVGENTNQFQPSDEVFGDISNYSGGGFSEYIAVPEDAFVLKPSNVSFVEAAAVPMAAVTALQGLRNMGNIQSGQKVLIYGASGGVGTFAVQIAKSFGTEVTAVCSTRNLEMARSMGADHVIDYTQEDFTKNGQQYDLVLAANGYRPISDYKQALTVEGTYVCTGGTMPQIFQGMLLGSLMTINSKKNMGSLAAKPDQKDLLFVKELIEAGKVTPIIDKHFPLSETSAAFHYLIEKHAQGKIIVSVGN